MDEYEYSVNQSSMNNSKSKGTLIFDLARPRRTRKEKKKKRQKKERERRKRRGGKNKNLGVFNFR